MKPIEKKPTVISVLLIAIALLGWFAVGAQFYIMMNSKAASVVELFIRFFSFFTIFTNILVAVCCTALGFFPESKWGKFFISAQVQTAVAVYILIVGLIYNLILRFLWSPEGLQWLVDELLHLVIPVLFLVRWFVAVPKWELQWRNFGIWLVYPLVYLGYIMIRGSFSGFYPYPFVDVSALGWNAVLINALGITFLFVFFSLVFIGIGKWISKEKN